MTVPQEPPTTIELLSELLNKNLPFADSVNLENSYLSQSTDANALKEHRKRETQRELVLHLQLQSESLRAEYYKQQAQEWEELARERNDSKSIKSELWGIVLIMCAYTLVGMLLCYIFM